MLEDDGFSHKIDCVTIFLEVPNLEEHPNLITGSRVTAILLNFAYWWSFSSGGSAINGATPSSLRIFL